MTDKQVTNALSRLELLGVAQAAEILKTFGQLRCRLVKVHYSPAIPFRIGTPDQPLPEPVVQPHHELTFILEDAMFGGEVFAAVACNGLVVVRPFLWPGYEVLAGMRITT